MSRSRRGIANVLRAALLNRLLLDSDLPLFDDLVAELEKGVNSFLLLVHMLLDEITSEQVLPLHTHNLILRINQLEGFFLVSDLLADLGILFTLCDQIHLLVELLELRLALNLLLQIFLFLAEL